MLHVTCYDLFVLTKCLFFSRVESALGVQGKTLTSSVTFPCVGERSVLLMKIVLVSHFCCNVIMADNCDNMVDCLFYGTL